MKVKKIVFVLLFLSIIAVFVSYRLTNKSKLSYDFAVVERGDVLQEVSATGGVNRGEEINLGFKQAGTLKEMYVKIGDVVLQGQELAKLETSTINIQLAEAEAALQMSQAKLDKVLAGFSQEDIEVARTAKENAEDAYDWALQNLEDAKTTADENLKSDYEDASNVLDSSYLKAHNASNEMISLCHGSFWVNYLIKDNKDEVRDYVSKMKTFSDKVKQDSSNQNIDEGLSEFEEYLVKIRDSLQDAKEKLDSPDYFYKISSTEKDSVDTQRSYINTALSNVISSRQTIVSTCTANTISLNTARASASSSWGALNVAKDQLALKTASPREEDVALNMAQVSQSIAKVNLLLQAIRDAILRSPLDGQITEIKSKIGESVQITGYVISLLPAQPFQIEVDIPETDISKIELQDSCRITLDAFPEKEFSGKVIEINPTESVIQGVVYYNLKSSFEADEDGIKPGMTANITITTDSRENVLVLPQRAVIKKDGKRIARVVSNKYKQGFEEVEVDTGLKGSEGEIEILSGVREGDKVITFIKDD